MSPTHSAERLLIMENVFGITHEHVLGKPTLHLPLNLIVQDAGEGSVAGVFQTRDGSQLLMGSKKTHQLILADVFIRPHLAFESDEFRGYGISNLFTTAWTESDKWAKGLIFDRRNQ